MSDGLVYFITDGEAYKIGWTTNLKKRLADLQNANHFPLVVIGTIDASRHQETILHKRFAQYRLIGEWFSINDEVKAYIRECREMGILKEPSEDDFERGSVAYMRLSLARNKERTKRVGVQGEQQ